MAFAPAGLSFLLVQQSTTLEGAAYAWNRVRSMGNAEGSGSRDGQRRATGRHRERGPVRTRSDPASDRPRGTPAADCEGPHAHEAEWYRRAHRRAGGELGLSH